jgi:IS1 family transposase
MLGSECQNRLSAMASGNSLKAHPFALWGGTSNVTRIRVSHWLPRVGRHCLHLIDYFFRNLDLSECQLDELWTFVYKKEKHLTAFETLRVARRYGDTWIWTAFDPVHKLVPTWRVGKRTLTDAKRFIQALKLRLDSRIPFFTSDDLPHYADALLAAYGVLVTPPRRFDRGRPPSPRLEPPPGLVYAVVIKEREHGHVTQVTTPVIYGTEAQVAACLRASPISETISTWGVERNRLRRHHSSTLASAHAPGQRLFQEAGVSQVSTGACLCVLSLLLSTSGLAREARATHTDKEWTRHTQTLAPSNACDGGGPN